MNTKQGMLAAGIAATLLLGTANAQPGAGGGVDCNRAYRGIAGQPMAGQPMAGQRMNDPRMGGPHSARHNRGDGLLRAGVPFGAAIGTDIEVAFYAEEPSEDVEPTTTLTLTVGEDSEAAFLTSFAAAREDAAYLVVTIGEQTRAVDLPDGVAGANVTTLRGRPALALGIQQRWLEDGDTVTVAFYDGDPAEGANELETLTFTYGQDSAIGFHQEVADAAEASDWAVVTLPSRTRTVDLSGIGQRGGMRSGPGAFGYGAFGPGRR